MTDANMCGARGGCTCGALRYELTASPLFVHCCHCRWCQRESGSAFAINLLIEAGNVRLLSGTPNRVAVPTNSGKGQTFSRCPECQIAVWSNYAGAGDAVQFVRAGSLDDADCVTPDIHIYTASKQPWVLLPPGVPAMPGYYRRSEHWPKASLDRYANLR